MQVSAPRSGRKRYYRALYCVDRWRGDQNVWFSAWPTGFQTKRVLSYDIHATRLVSEVYFLTKVRCEK